MKNRILFTVACFVMVMTGYVIGSRPSAKTVPANAETIKLSQEPAKDQELPDPDRDYYDGDGVRHAYDGRVAEPKPETTPTAGTCHDTR